MSILASLSSSASASASTLALSSADYDLVNRVRDAESASEKADALSSASAFNAYAAEVATRTFEIAQAQIDKEESDNKEIESLVRPLALAICYIKSDTGKVSQAGKLFKLYRGPYAKAKQANKDNASETHKKTMKRVARAWRLASKQAGRVFEKEGFAVYWPDVSTGRGEIEIKTRVQDGKDKERERAEQALQDARDAKEASDAENMQELSALRSLSPEKLALFVYNVIRENGADVDNVLTMVKELSESDASESESDASDADK